MRFTNIILWLGKRRRQDTRIQWSILLRIATVTLGFLLTAPDTHAASQKIVLGFYSADPLKNAAYWLGTPKYLNQQIAGARFVMRTFDSIPLLEHALKNKEVDFLILDGVNYVRLEAQWGVTRLATHLESRENRIYSVTAATLIARANDESIRRLSDLRNRKLIALGVNRTDLWWAVYGELKKAGLDPFRDLSLHSDDDPQRIVNLVLEGKFDVGALPAGLLEQLASSQRLRLDQLKIVHPYKHQEFPFRSSTPLYPNWTFSKTRHAPDEIAKQLTLALLNMPHRSTRDISAVAGWTVPRDYSPVHTLLRYLKIEPYENYAHITLRQVLSYYWPWILGAVVVILILLVISIYLYLRNLRLQKTEQQLIDSKGALQEIVAQDGLTQLTNRRRLDENLRQEWWRACRDQTPMSALIVDVENLSDYYDANGRLAGDQRLIQIADCIRQGFKRSVDVKARYGRDEFVIILPGTPEKESKMLAVLLKKSIDALSLNEHNRASKLISVGVGVATLIPQKNSVPDELLAAADAALYASKQRS